MTQKIETLKNSRSYRGQIYRVVSIPGREAQHDSHEYGDEENPLSRIPAILASFNLTHLYKYQGELLKDLLRENSIGLFAPAGSGKKTTIAVAAAIYSLLTGKTALILCENETEAGIIEEMLGGPIGRLVKVSKHDEEHTTLDIACDILVATDRKIKKLIYETYDKMQDWTSMLGLIVVSSVTSFSSPRISHLQGLLAFFDAATEKGSGLSYLISGEQIGNPLNVISELTGREEAAGISIFSDFGKEKNPYEIVGWLPPYTINEKGAGQVIKRSDYNGELGSFFALFSDKTNLLVWHSYASISKDKLEEWISRYQFSGKITLIKHLAEVQLSKTGLFDGLILMGFPKNPKAVIETLGSILVARSTVGFILPNDPFSHFLIKSDNPAIDLPFPEFIIPKGGAFVSSAYLFLYAHLSKLSVLRKSDLSPIQLNGILKNKKALIKAGFLSFEDEDSFALNAEALVLRAKEWFFESQTADAIEIQIGPSSRYFDSYLLPQTLFVGAIHYFGEIPYHLIKEKDVYAFLPLSGVAPVKRLPLLSHKIVEVEEIDSFSGDFQVSLSSAKLEITWNGIKEYKSFTATPEDADIIEVTNKETYTRETYIFRISANGIGHELMHLFRIWLPLSFSNIFDFYETFHDDSNVYFYALLPNEAEAKALLLTLPTILRKVSGLSKELLLHSCPCKKGCPFCLNILDCPSAKENVNKKSTIIQVLKYLNEDMDSLIRFKYAGLIHTEAQRYYEDIARKIFSIFENKLDLVIQNKVPIVACKTTSFSKSGSIGLFTGNSVQVIEGLDEAKATEVIAHEYAHNWAAENMAPPQDYPPGISEDDKIKSMMHKLISEGFAQWVAFKVMDYFGLESSMAGIYLWAFDEYGEGFRVLNWLESQLGFMAVIDFAKNGKTIGEGGTEWGLDTILDKSGLKARVLHWITNNKPQ